MRVRIFVACLRLVSFPSLHFLERDERREDDDDDIAESRGFNLLPKKKRCSLWALDQE